MREALIARSSILERLRSTIAGGSAVLGAGCSAGIVAKCAELGGADLIVVYSTGRSRLMGLPTWRLGHSNPATLAMASEILNVVSNTPVIGGAEAGDPTRLDLDRLLDDFVLAGFSGIINFPTLSNMPDLRRRGEAVGIGFEREVSLIAKARRRDVFSMAYVATPDDGRRMADAGVDCIVTHSGPTTGGLAGYRFDGSLEKLSHDVQHIIGAAREVSPEVICLIHGGPLATPAQVQVALSRTTADGFVGASSVERIPIETAILSATRAFKTLKTGRPGSPALPPVAIRSIPVYASDLDASARFYGRLFGLVEERHQRGRRLRGGSFAIELVPAGLQPCASGGCLQIEVDDLEAARYVLNQLEIEVKAPRDGDEPGVLYVEDPDGLTLRLSEPNLDEVA